MATKSEAVRRRTDWSAPERTPNDLGIPDQPRELYKRLNVTVLTTVFPFALESVTRACPKHSLNRRRGTEVPACSSWQPSWRTLELRGKQDLDSGIESFVELSCLGQDTEVVEAVLFPVWPGQSFVSLPLSVLVLEPRSGARHGVAAWPGCSVACILVVFCGGSVLLFRVGGGRSQAGEQREWLSMVCGFPTSQCVRSLGWFCLWALDLVEV
ncbi:hypothetical protein Taro_052097 [Colocasia esculenta]|uniref:Uncharacterized protein n=1 Tax=Colocasia esculenta TaxID=4460 RepID=A0A843XHJ8_COLES|nr:hypothetical protein [Colocasia esculenta]